MAQRRTKDEQINELKCRLEEDLTIIMKLNSEINRLKSEKEDCFLSSPTYLQMLQELNHERSQKELLEIKLRNYVEREKRLQMELKEQKEQQVATIHNARGAGRKPDQERRRLFRQLIEQGKSAEEIIDAMGCSRRTFYRYKSEIDTN